MFETVQEAPRDAILGLTEAFRADSNPNKINLSVGVYKDSKGTTPTLAAVAEAERRLADEGGSKAYLPIDGDPDYASALQKLMFGAQHEVVQAKRARTSHTPGGTGALRVVADFLHANLPNSTLWLSEPTWPNHPNIFAAAGVPMKTYAYFDQANHGIDFEELLKAIDQIPSGDAILLHGCCHNPTGADPTPQQWEKITQRVADRQLLPILDFAYQGFADGLTEDADGLRTLCQEGQEMLVCSSFSKNFGLYCERVGAMTVVAKDSAAADVAQSQVKRTIRANYSNPPAHGGRIVKTILQDHSLTKQWQQELAQMRDRINGMRKLLVDKLAEHGVAGDYEFITNQRGMFSFSGLKPEQVDTLREKHSIYIVRSGRINVAGITGDNVDRLCSAIAEVTS